MIFRFPRRQICLAEIGVLGLTEFFLVLVGRQDFHLHMAAAIGGDDEESLVGIIQLGFQHGRGDQVDILQIIIGPIMPKQGQTVP